MKTINSITHAPYLFLRSISFGLALVFVLLLASKSFAQTTYSVGKYQLLLLDSTYYDITGADTFQVTTNYILIKLYDDISENERQDFETRYPITSLYVTSIKIILYEINSGTNFIELIENLAGDSYVQHYDINHLCPLTDISRPNDSYATVQSELGYHPNLLWPYIYTNLFEAWNITSGSPNIIVADLDDGLWIDHPDLSTGNDDYSNLWENPGEIPGNNVDDDQNFKVDDIHGWNFPANNNDLLLEIYPMESHGTRMASIIAAKTNNNEGIWGVAGGYGKEGASVMMLNCRDLEFPDSMDDAFFPIAIEYAVLMGARIINMPVDVPPNQSLESTILTHSQQDDIIFLGGAGNYNDSSVIYPARYEGVMAIGASQSNADIPDSPEYKWYIDMDYGSNYGEGLDFLAPGGLFAADVTGSEGNYSPSYGYKTYWDTDFSVSTSRAVSFASGVVALILSLYPCLHNYEVEEILKNTTDKIGQDIYTYDEDGWSEMAGYGRINVLKALKPKADTITEITTWNSDRIILGDIFIENQAELIIEHCTVSFGKLSKVMVNRGGILNIQDGAVLTGLCDEMWNGIEVWGNRNESQYTQEAQGMLIINSGTIENALLAADLWKPGTTEMTGGIIEAHDALFLNNAKSVRAIYYRNANPDFPNQEMDYYGTFDDCSFILDEQYLGTALFEKHVDLAQVRGLKFYGCTFSLDHTAEFVSNHSIGLAAYNAGFYVLPTCTTQVVPCPLIDSCVFSGFNIAIGIWTPVQLVDPPILIKDAHFDNNSTGVYIDDHDFSVILENFFEAGYNDPYHGNCDFADGVGIDIHHSNGFIVENNKLRKNDDATTGNYAGIRVKDCRSVHDIIYKNEFDGLSFGNFAEGTNRSDVNIAFTGVEYQCNRNSHNASDFIVIDEQEPREAMIRGYHGSQDTASGNAFSRYLPIPQVWHFENWGTSLINYYYCDPCTDEEPINIYANPPELFEKDSCYANNCPDHYGGGGHIKLTYGERQEKEEIFAQNLDDYNSVNYLYESLIDGGDTETELSEIESAEPEEMWELRSQLLGDSPHLSQKS